MKKINSRTIHRYLSLVIGIQLLFWTVSGLIFSWNPISKVRGEDLIAVQETNLDLADVIGLGELVEKNPTLLAGSTISEVHLRELVGSPVIEVAYTQLSGTSSRKIFDGTTGELISPISEELARKIATADFAETAEVRSGGLCDIGEFTFRVSRERVACLPSGDGPSNFNLDLCVSRKRRCGHSAQQSLAGF